LGGVAIDSPIVTMVGAPEPTAHHTPGSGTSRFKFFYNQLFNIIGFRIEIIFKHLAKIGDDVVGPSGH
jgi:hypothetical protein